MAHEPLPLRSAMFRNDLKESRLEVVNAYAHGRLIDGQALADAWNSKFAHGSVTVGDAVKGIFPELAEVIETAITEETTV